jgi:hypothetical protein
LRRIGDALVFNDFEKLRDQYVATSQTANVIRCIEACSNCADDFGVNDYRKITLHRDEYCRRDRRNTAVVDGGCWQGQTNGSKSRQAKAGRIVRICAALIKRPAHVSAMVF